MPKGGAPPGHGPHNRKGSSRYGGRGGTPWAGTRGPGGATAGGRAPTPPPYKSNKNKGGDCAMWVPVAVALLPYALVRLALDGWRSRHGDAS